MALLELLHDGNAVLVEAEDVVVGRTQACTVRLVHPLVSREHCRLELRRDGVYVVDLGSANGTWVNGLRVTSRLRLRTGDLLGLGREGAVLELRRAEFDGTDVALTAREEDVHTLIAGDPRAAGVVARIEVAAEAVPKLTNADAPTGTLVVPRSSSPIAAPAASAASAPAPAPPAPSRGFLPGFALGFLAGLVAVGAVARLTSVRGPGSRDAAANAGR